MPRQRTIAACHKAAVEALINRATAAAHLASLSPERRAQLEREWEQPK